MDALDFAAPPADVVAHMRAVVDAQTDPEMHDRALLCFAFLTDPAFRRSMADATYTHRAE